jgi:AcrR family transcriptional regulator
MPLHELPPPATRRADAERNRDKILAAAQSAFADPGAEVSMVEISRRAGVGMATLYRNFPGRQELLETLFADEVDAVCEAAKTVDGETPAAELVKWLHRFFAFVTSKRHIASELLKHTDGNPLFDNNRARVIAAGRPLLAAAQRTHEVRDDISLEQLFDMIISIAMIHGNTRYLEPLLQTALDGLGAPSDRSSPWGARTVNGAIVPTRPSEPPCSTSERIGVDGVAAS